MSVQKPISTGPFPMALLHFARSRDFQSEWLTQNGWATPIPLVDIAGNLGRVLDHATFSSASAISGDVLLFEDGCQAPNTAAKWPRTIFNCTAACADPQRMFADSKTMWNCATLASVDLLAQTGNLKVGEKDTSLPNAFGFDVSAAISSLSSCALDSCQSSDVIDCSEGLKSDIGRIGYSLNINDSGAAVEGLQSILASYCDAAKPDHLVNIAGPGVLISFIAMTILSLSLFLLLKPFTSWLRLVLLPVHSLSPRSSPSTKSATHPWASATASQARLSRTRPAAALFTTLVDFHEVQLWFVLAIQISALIVMTLFQPFTPSFASYYLSNDMVTVLATLGFLPSLLTELQVRRATAPGRPSLHSWWTLLLTTATWGMGGAILSLNGPWSRDIGGLMDEARGVASCGGRAGLATYCGLERARALEPWHWIIYSLGVGYPIVPGLWAQQIAWAIACWGKSEETVRRRGRYGIGIAGVLRRRAEAGSRGHRIGLRLWVGILECIWALFQGACLVFSLVYVVVLFRLLDVAGMGLLQWTFGQVIAMGIWIPVGSRFLSMMILGVKSTFKVRLMEGYEVVHREREDAIRDDEDSPFADSVLEDD